MSTIKSLNHFISHCNQVIGELNSAHNMEVVDAFTSNNSLLGFGVSLLSSSKNYSAADSVDHLQNMARNLNEKLHRKGIFKDYACRPIGTNFTGFHVRNAERLEHGFFENLISNGMYSNFASYNTINTISQTSHQIVCARQDAYMLRSYIEGRKKPFCEPSVSSKTESYVSSETQSSVSSETDSSRAFN